MFLLYVCEGIEVFRSEWDRVSCLPAWEPCKFKALLSFPLLLLSDLCTVGPLWLNTLFQVLWWINLASLGLYLIMVAVASVALHRGFSLGQKRMGIIINSGIFLDHSFSSNKGIIKISTKCFVLHAVFQSTLMCLWEEEDCFSLAGCFTMHLSILWAVSFTITTTSLPCSSAPC